MTRLQRAADRLQHLDSAGDVLLDSLVFFAGQAGGLVKQVAADLELADVVEGERRL